MESKTNSINYNRDYSKEELEALEEIKTLFKNFKQENKVSVSKDDSKFKPLYIEIQRLYDISLKAFFYSKEFKDPITKQNYLKTSLIAYELAITKYNYLTKLKNGFKSK